MTMPVLWTLLGAIGLLAQACGPVRTVSKLKLANISDPSVEPFFSAPKVVLIVLDGVRWQEFFAGAELNRLVSDAPEKKFDSSDQLMPFVWQHLIVRENAFFAGNQFQNNFCFVSNPYRVSLPAYADLLTGERQPNIQSNSSSELPQLPTLLDRLLSKGLPAAEMAVLSSWEKIAQVASTKSSPPFWVDSGLHEQESVPLWGGARWDSDTAKAVGKVVESSSLRFLFVAFNDSDEYGHLGQYAQYLSAVHRQDEYIQNIYYNLESKPAYRGKTTYIITTDHGRGSGSAWPYHNASTAGSESIWAVIKMAPNLLNEQKIWVQQKMVELNRDCQHTRLTQIAEMLLQF